MYVYKTKGVCSSEIHLEVNNGIVESVEFVGGCRGNTQGVAALAVGRKVEDVIAVCKGIECRGTTSCPDQLAHALEEMTAQA